MTALGQIAALDQLTAVVIKWVIPILTCITIAIIFWFWGRNSKPDPEPTRPKRRLHSMRLSKVRFVNTLKDVDPWSGELHYVADSGTWYRGVDGKEYHVERAGRLYAVKKFAGANCSVYAGFGGPQVWYDTLETLSTELEAIKYMMEL